MSSITLTSVTLGNLITVPVSVSVKYRKTSDPDIAGSYTDLGQNQIDPTGTFVTPIVINSLLADTSYTVWISLSCSNTSVTKAFTTPSASVGNDFMHQLTKRDNCDSGFSGTTVDYQVPANTYFADTKDDANALAEADITANAQNWANDPGNGAKCLSTDTTSTLEVDFNTDVDADICVFLSTPGFAETNQYVAASQSGGPLIYPNDGRDPSQALHVSSDKIDSAPYRRFVSNLAYLIAKYPTQLTWTFDYMGWSTADSEYVGQYAARDITEGVMVQSGSPGAVHVGVSAGVSIPAVFSSHIVSGSDGTVGPTKGSLILRLVYDVTAKTLTPTTA